MATMTDVLLNPDEPMPAHITNCDIHICKFALSVQYTNTLAIANNIYVCTWQSYGLELLVRMQLFAIRY